MDQAPFHITALAHIREAHGNGIRVHAQIVKYSLKRRDRGGQQNVAVKLDMNKAYDRLDWDFLKEVLEAYGFDQRWVDLVMKLVTTVMYRYKVNGFLGDTIVPSRALRQGDPLSPYLFILAVDTLSHMIDHARSRGLIEGIQLVRNSLTLTHLFFYR